MYEERIYTFAIPSKFSCKVLNVFMTDQGQCKSQLGIDAAGWALRALNKIPNGDGDESEELWLLCRTSCILPAQLISCLSEAPNVATCYIGCAGVFLDFIEQVTSNMHDMDAMYVISWEDWFPILSHSMPVSVMRPGDEVEGDDGGEGESDSGQPMEPLPPPPSPRYQKDTHQASQASGPG